MPNFFEIKILSNDRNGVPSFEWITVNPDAIESIMPARAQAGGSTIRMRSGVTLLSSVDYVDVFAAMTRDQNPVRLTSSEPVELEILQPIVDQMLAEQDYGNGEVNEQLEAKRSALDELAKDVPLNDLENERRVHESIMREVQARMEPLKNILDELDEGFEDEDDEANDGLFAITDDDIEDDEEAQ